ncbi:MAG: hypothetical protein U0R44_03490 [Candidatus Micrarchaeia archaeon]
MTKPLVPIRREDVNDQGRRHGVEIPPDFRGGSFRLKIASEPLVEKPDDEKRKDGKREASRTD